MAVRELLGCQVAEQPEYVPLLGAKDLTRVPRFSPLARRRLVAALTRNGAPQVLSGGLESGVLITMVEGEVLRVAFEEEGRRPG